MIKVMIDTNIILDVFQQRNGFYSNSAQVLNAIEAGDAVGFIPASTMTDIFYIARKSTGSKTMAYEALKLVKSILNIAAVMPDDIDMALEKRANDFEDCVLACCAKSHECDYIITRNKKDYQGFDISAITPSEFLELMP
ncbi:MAG: PIN domain-containing protein [Eubacterium sp.]|nr:PIN domain-containing protein [Candidatus Colimonas fimequi]